MSRCEESGQSGNVKDDDDTVFRLVLDTISKKRSIMVSGEAGTGKSTLMKRVSYHLMKNPLLNVHVVAPTGVAAVNAGGVTIHSWLGLGLADKDSSYYLRRLDKYPVMQHNLTRTSHLIIDEISMITPHMFQLIHTLCCFLRKDMLPCRKNPNVPFGGMILMLFGDFCQLKSIIRSDKEKGTHNQNQIGYGKTLKRTGQTTILSHLTNPNSENKPEPLRFMFETPIWKKLGADRIWLRHNYRQGNDLRYATLLNRVRTGGITPQDIRTLRSRVIYKLPDKKLHLDPQGRVEVSPPILTTHKDGVVQYNNDLLTIVSEQYDKPIHTYHPTIKYVPGPGKKELTQSQLSSETERLQDRCPVFRLRVCVNAQVMMRCNSMMKDNGIVNGTLGIVRFVSDKSIKVSFRVNGFLTKPIAIQKYQFPVKTSNGTIYMTQFPLSLAYSCTIHKSQSISLDQAIVNIKHCFEESMVYVALSRVRTLDGLQIQGMFDTRWFHPNQKALAFETDPVIEEMKIQMTKQNLPKEVQNCVLSYIPFTHLTDR